MDAAHGVHQQYGVQYAPHAASVIHPAPHWPDVFSHYMRLMSLQQRPDLDPPQSASQQDACGPSTPRAQEESKASSSTKTDGFGGARSHSGIHVVSLYRTRECYNMRKTGRCGSDINCWYTHTESETRPPTHYIVRCKPSDNVCLGFALHGICPRALVHCSRVHRRNVGVLELANDDPRVMYDVPSLVVRPPRRVLTTFSRSYNTQRR
jgi:hypothetical protein